jgi:hypothetical protein
MTENTETDETAADAPEAPRNCPDCGLETTQMEQGLSYCPRCFILRAEEKGIRRVWEIKIAGANQPPDQQPPPVDNQHVAEGCEQFGAGKTHSGPQSMAVIYHPGIKGCMNASQSPRAEFGEDAANSNVRGTDTNQCFRSSPSPLWRTQMSSEGESGNAPSVFSDIYKGDELVVSRIPFQQADKWVERCNQEAREADGQYKGKTAKEWFKLHEVMRNDFERVLIKMRWKTSL